jgi:CHAD domain-containing protein
MVTTTTDGTSVDPAAPPFAEQDKLGPLGGKRAILVDETELRRMLVAEFLATAEAAREAAADVDRAPATAVHEFRKALRRARAVLSLVSDALPRNEWRAVQRALREARRALATARDHTVAPATLDLLTLGEVERGTATAIVTTASEAIPPVAELRQLLAEGAARAAAQVEALEAALPPTIPWAAVARGVRRVYGEARRARKAAKRSKRAFHTWRRRSKELTYQLDLLAGYAGPRVAELQREVEGATDTQGPAVDLIMVREYVRTHAAGVAPEALDGLVAALSAQLDDVLADSRRAGRDAFRRKPRRFARRLTKAVRRDLAPVRAEDELGGD